MCRKPKTYDLELFWKYKYSIEKKSYQDTKNCSFSIRDRSDMAEKMINPPSSPLLSSPHPFSPDFQSAISNS